MNVSSSMPPPGAAPRVGVVGASRRRQGLGPFVVRDLRDVGARVACFLATRADTRDATQRELAERFQVESRGYLDLDTMLREEKLDALAILSPSGSHAAYLARALDAGLHTLCEKPLIWEADDAVQEAARIVEGFERAGLVLHENCQWPYTLPAFAQLHPGVLQEPLRSFEMQMQPVNPGIGRLADSMPHALSLVQALLPGDGCIEELHFTESPAEGGTRLEVEFSYRAPASSARVRVSLQRYDAFPRRVAYAINGRRALREVDEAYCLHFADGDRSVPVEDPLSSLVADFVAEVAGRCGGGRSEEILHRVALLDEIARGYRRWERPVRS